MNVLIIGGTGFIGKNLCKRLLAENHSVFVIGKGAVNQSNVFDIKIADIDSIKKIIIDNDIDHIIHLANTILPNSKFDNFMDSIDEIVKPTYELIEFCEEQEHIKFIFYSSGGTIYGNTENTKEDMRPEPTSYYGYSKQIIEEFLMMKIRSGFNGLIVRPSNPYGPGQNPNGSQGIIAVLIGKVLNNEEFILYSPLTAKKDYIYIDDLVDATYQLMLKHSGIYNIGSGQQNSIQRIFEIIEDKMNKKILLKVEKSNVNYIHDVDLDVTKLKNTINVSDYKSIEQGIGEFIDYLIKENK
jgi:UDP-glucose 4-epimerase